ncbi:sensor histidine kinase [Tautonia plasticadhaerens]|uniref:histidine kinase n=1 Tax=Tautonia plasticadhaerens TaxID=2527974 RepID=A0A518H9G0_9BACT|nr:PAS domain S-box protein [Tautonia plasticadhaerens]QDV37481.1 Phytochrome-like protein cph1 [Tautonia plasticadhaerens]
MSWSRDGRDRRIRGPGIDAMVALAAGILAASAGLAVVRGLPDGLAGALLGAAVALPIGVIWGVDCTRRRWRRPIRRINETLVDRPQGIGLVIPSPRPKVGRDAPIEVQVLARSVVDLQDRLSFSMRALNAGSSGHPREAMTRSGLFNPPSEPGGGESSSSNSFEGEDMIGRLDPGSLRWTEASPALQTFLGAGLDRLRDLSILELLHPDDRVPAGRQLRDVSGRGEALGLVYRMGTLGGDRKAVELNVSARYGPDGVAVYLRCHVTDVTEQIRARREERRRTRELIRLNDELRRTNRALAELKDRYSDLYQNAPAMYFSLDLEGRLLVCNDTLLKTLGYSRRDLIGRPYENLLPVSDRPTFRGRFAQYLQDGRIEAESRWAAVDGREIDVFVTAVAVRDSEGRLLHSRSVAQDITTRKRLEAELRRNNDRLARINDELSRKNTELDEFSYVISHDLQEPVRTLIAFSGFLRQEYTDRLDEQAIEYLDYLTEASSRMRTLIQDLLELSRAGRTAADFGPVPLDLVLATLRVDYAELIRAKGAEVTATGPLPTCWGDRTRIGQLLGNLIGNGLKYNESGQPRVEIGVIPTHSPGDGRRVTLAIRDNGIGIDPQFHDKIFQMFRRLHARDRYDGTGAGLAICQKIARAHGGRIWVESSPGEGSTFFVELPIAPSGSLTTHLPSSGHGPTAPANAPDDAIHAR